MQRGVHLQGEEKERFNEIKQELSQISTKFSNNLLVRCIFVPAHFHPDVLQAICQGLGTIHALGCHSMIIPLSLHSGISIDEFASMCRHVQDATKAFKKLITEKKDVDGLPESALALAAQQACPLHIAFHLCASGLHASIKHECLQGCSALLT